MNILTSHQQEIKRLLRRRHYYLKLAYLSNRTANIGDIHIYCKLAERDQYQLDNFAIWYPSHKFV